MDHSHSFGYELDKFLPRLFERLHEIPDVVWDESTPPLHSSYDDWIAFGERTIPQRASSQKSSPNSSIHAFPAVQTGRSAHERSPSLKYAPSEELPPVRQHIAARITRHVLRLEREYQLSETLLAESDPNHEHHVHPLQALRLRPRKAGDVPLLVILVEFPGFNALRNLISFGPNFYNAEEAALGRRSSITGTHNVEVKQRVELTDFLDFAIGATACLEMLHQGNRLVHGEIRGDSFHWNRETGKVKLTNFGSGVRSFENGLTSAGWSTLSRERGVEYKLQFIAPEQTGRLPAAPDSRTDIYSLGVIFWIILAGEKPFHGDTPLEIMQNVLGRRIPPIASRRLDVPDCLGAVIQKMVHKNIEDRYHSANGLRHDLCQIQRLFAEGDSTSLQTFVIGSKDVNCFFNLPNIQVGRDVESKTIINVIQRVAGRQDKRFRAQAHTQAQHAIGSMSSRSGSIGESGVQTDENGSQGGSGNFRGSPSSIVPLTTSARTHESRDSFSDLEGSAFQNSAWPSYTLDSRLSVENSNSMASDRPTGTGSTLSFADGAGSILRNNQKYKHKYKCEVITVSGVTGLGKSCLIHSVQGVARRYGYFATARFDQMKRTPFEAVLKVMSSLFRQIFSETEMTDFHQSLRAFVRPVWHFLHGMLGLPLWLIETGTARSASAEANGYHDSSGDGERSARANRKAENEMMCGGAGHTTSDFLSSGASAKSSRFTAIFLDILRFLSTHRLILLCLDDLQFADDESLVVLQSILLAKIQLVLIATFREKADLSAKVRSLLDSGAAIVTEVELTPLPEAYVAEYVSATLQRNQDYVLPLVAVIQEKTRGNPFYLREMLDSCYRQHCIWYSWTESNWVYDLDKVFALFESQDYGSSINNDFVIKRLQELGPNTRLFLAWASLIGSSFSFRLVKKLMSGSSGTHHLPSIDGKAHLIRQTSKDAVQGLHGAIAAYIIMPGEDDDHFRFCHDRYLQAAISLEERQDSVEMQYQIAQALMTQLFDDESTMYIKSAHIVAAVDLIKKRVPFRAVFRDVLFRAAEKSIESGGRSMALTYYGAALKLLQLNPWDDSAVDVSYEETLVLYTRAAECYWIQGEEDEALRLIKVTFEKARDAPDKAASWVLQGRILARRGDHYEAFFGLKTCLAELGQAIPDTSWEDCDKRFRELHQELIVVDKEALLNRKLTDCRLYKSIGAVLVELMAAAYWSDALLYYKMALVEVELNLYRGNVTQAGLAYTHLAACAISRFNMIEFGVDMGNLAKDYFARFSHDYYVTGRGIAAHTMMVSHISTHVKDTLPVLEASLETSLAAGDRYSSLLGVSFVATMRVWASHDLGDIESFCSYAAEEIVDWERDARGGVMIIAVRQYCRALQGKTLVESAEGIFSDQNHNTAEYLQLIETQTTKTVRAKASYSAYVVIALFLYGHIDEAMKTAEQCLEMSSQMWSSRQVPSNEFFLGLCYASTIRDNPESTDRERLITLIRKYRDNIIAWSAYTDINYRVWSALLTAELAGIEGDYAEAMRSYEAALDHAEVHGFMFEQALAYELYAEHGIRKGAKRPARASLVEAISAYRKISAFGKARYITEKYEWLLQGTSCLGTVDVGCQTLEVVDRHAVEIHEEEAKHDLHSRNGTVHPVRTNEDLHGHGLEAFGLDMIDLASILRSSQVLSSELQMDKLLKKMASIIVESTGAELCAIVTEDEQIEWNIAVVMDALNPDREYPVGQSLNCVEDVVGKQVTLYCLRFKETVFLHNVLEDDRFSNVPDSYRHQYPDGQAIIASPILHGDGEVLGCVYIQGPPHSFTERNMTVLRLLINSTSISMTNAKLFNRVEKVSASNLVMISSQKEALAKARKAEAAAKTAEAEAIRNMKLKEEASKAKSMFLANISHELRTPLNGVIGMSELLKDSQLTADQKEYANSIHICADTLLTLINDILDFSKLEAGKMQIFSVPLRLTETIAEVVRALSFTNIEKHLETITKLDIIDEPLVMGDPVRLHQILMNLLSNAYKFTSHGSVTVKATVDRQDAESITMTCSVIDTGLGITDEQKKKLFLPFSQADSSTARSFGGTGLGLSICKAIIENVMKGKIWLESEPGVGTTVSFSLSFQKAPKSYGEPNEERQKSRDPMAIFTPPPSASPSSAPPIPIHDISGVARADVRVCIAEDNPINQRIAISFVKKLGFQAFAYSDGRQAVDALAAAAKVDNPFHIVLMDVQMPVLDGYNATREIRKHAEPAVREVLVIAMTASAIRGDREKCLDAGMNDYLAKPVRAQVLKKMLEAYWTHGTSQTGAEVETVSKLNGEDDGGAPNGKTLKVVNGASSTAPVDIAN